MTTDAKAEIGGVEAAAEVPTMQAVDPYEAHREAKERVRLWMAELDKKIERDMRIEKIFGLDMFQVMKWKNKQRKLGIMP
jgi:hypothetical protein